jgi:hypothetical protein
MSDPKRAVSVQTGRSEANFLLKPHYQITSREVSEHPTQQSSRAVAFATDARFEISQLRQTARACKQTSGPHAAGHFAANQTADGENWSFAVAWRNARSAPLGPIYAGALQMGQ